MESVVGEIDIFTSATGNFNIITLDHMKKMKNNAIIGNIGHFDNEIDMAGLEGMEGIKVENIKPQVDRFVFPDRHGRPGGHGGHQGGEHQAAGGPLRFPRSTWPAWRAWRASRWRTSSRRWTASFSPIDMAGLEGMEGIKVENIKPQVD